MLCVPLQIRRGRIRRVDWIDAWNSVHLNNVEILMLIVVVVVVIVVMVVAAVVQGSSIVRVYGIYIHPGRDKNPLFVPTIRYVILY